jgi:phage-related protein
MYLARYGFAVYSDHDCRGPTLKKLPAYFYRSRTGQEPVREWLRTLSEEDRRILGRDIAIVEFGWPVGMPICRPLGGGLWEVRSNLTGNRIAQVLFCLARGQLVLLHGFVKKSQTAPQGELELARRRQREVES